MQFVLDPLSGLPLHRQVYDTIRSVILNGGLHPGDRLPATRVLATELGVARATVAEAYNQLRVEGYVHGKHGSGTYVASDLPRPAVMSGQNGTAGLLPSRQHVRLSRWGSRIMQEYRQNVAPEDDCPEILYDLRPHRVAGDQFPWPSWHAAVDRAKTQGADGLLDYPPVAGHGGLREAIALHVANYRAVSCSPDQIVIVNGSQQGLNLLVQLLLDAGDRVAVEDPGYPAARQIFQTQGMRLTHVPVDAGGLQVDMLNDAPVHRMIHVTPSHQEPTGATLSLSRRLALLEVAERDDCVLVEDDYDSEFRYEGRPVESLQGLDRSGRVVYAGTFSKSLLAGLRLGFLILPPCMVRPFLAAKSLWDGGTPMFEQAILAEFMQSGDFERHIRRMRRLYRARRDALMMALETNFGSLVKVGVCHGGLNVLVTFNLAASEQEIVRAAGRAGVALRPASSYYAVQPAASTFLLGFASLSEGDIRDGINRLAQALTAVH